MGLPNLDKIWSISNLNFNEVTLEIFQFQVKNNPVYSKYINLIGQDPSEIDHYSKIPFLPIQFFKTHKVCSTQFKPAAIFESSSTTGINTSKHYIKDVNQYHKNSLKTFELLIGALSNYEVLGLLPNYLERGNSSLVSMVKSFMEYNKQSNNFFLYNHDELNEKLCSSTNKKFLLFGVSFALLDFAENHTINNNNLLIIETGGMKGRKKEITKEQVYQDLQDSFPNATIISEYGMTELLSQAYSNTQGIYSTPPWMKVLPRADTDPLSFDPTKRTCALNIIDLANINSCSFIATDDLGIINEDGTFSVIGRLDNADLRGCSLMIS